MPLAHDYDKNTTKYTCDTIDCRCIQDEMLCGKDGSIGKGEFGTIYHFF